ncbi:MAG: hypothetical protein AB7F75_06305 [Planctomycetota bacterium]
MELHVPELNVIFRSYDSYGDSDLDINNRNDEIVVVHFMRQQSTKANLLDQFKDVHTFHGLRFDRHFVYGLRMVDWCNRWSLLDLQSGLIRDFADIQQLNSTLEGMNIKAQPLLLKDALFAGHPQLPGIVEFFSRHIVVIAMFTFITFVAGWCMTLVPAFFIAQLSFWGRWSASGDPSVISVDESQKDGFPRSRE